MTTPSSSESHLGRTALRSLLVAATTVGAVAIVRLAWRDPRYAMVPLAAAGIVGATAWSARARIHRTFLSGDVMRVLSMWENSIQRAIYPETMAPLMIATAYAAYGWVEAARASFEQAARGPAWEAAVEQRLFVETLLDTFQGDRSAALAKASSIQRLPFPQAGLFARVRIRRMREGLAAFARAFAHASLQGDLRCLTQAANAAPLVYWAMRYAAAIVEVDHGKPQQAAVLLAGAPTWPETSAFRLFHEELLAKTTA
jgi:hypothetical protein